MLSMVSFPSNLVAVSEGDGVEQPGWNLPWAPAFLGEDTDRGGLSPQKRGVHFGREANYLL